VLIVDDVVTTGSTLAACAKTLKQAGVQQITAVTLAHEG
jgi:predicted amidophosphoribosyltransferase